MNSDYAIDSGSVVLLEWQFFDTHVASGMKDAGDERVVRMVGKVANRQEVEEDRVLKYVVPYRYRTHSGTPEHCNGRVRSGRVQLVHYK
jgi:hypothetical protein